MSSFAKTDELVSVDALPADTDHAQVTALLRGAGWQDAGAGDWAIALRSPSGMRAARISPFDPAAPWTAELYRRGATTKLLPRLDRERALAGGGSLLVLEWLYPVEPEEGNRLHMRLRDGDPTLAPLRDVLDEVSAEAAAVVPWFGPVDDNPANVMRADDGRLVLTDPFYVDGSTLYATVLADPDLVARAIPLEQRRGMFDLPLAGSGQWHPEERDLMRSRLEAADRVLSRNDRKL